MENFYSGGRSSGKTLNSYVKYIESLERVLQQREKELKAKDEEIEQLRKILNFYQLADYQGVGILKNQLDEMERLCDIFRNERNELRYKLAGIEGIINE